jgi:DNA polymerase (family 10)
MSFHRPTNEEIADVLERIAALLEAQGAIYYRVNAYRRAARLVESSEQSIAELADVKEGDTLEDLPDIGKSIASSIRELVHTGRLGLLERLEGQIAPEDLFTTVPGIGEELAKRIHAELHIDTLEELELTAHDGRLEKVPGIGNRRVKAIRDSLEAMLSRSSRRRARRLRHLDQERMERGEADVPSVAAVLEVDEEYRRKASEGTLRTIFPRRFNPEGKAWLPVLHTEREGWQFTALFSNTARAHELNKTRDWVVIYYEKDGHENQNTVVTESHGSLKGRRVVRGREGECFAFYSSKPGSSPGSCCPGTGKSITPGEGQTPEHNHALHQT